MIIHLSLLYYCTVAMITELNTYNMDHMTQKPKILFFPLYKMLGPAPLDQNGISRIL